MLRFFESKIEDRSIFRWLSLSIVVLVISLTLAVPVMRIGFNFAIDYNEGWNVYHSIRAAAKEVLYDNKINEWTPINYPPLSFYVVGNFGNEYTLTVALIVATGQHQHLVEQLTTQLVDQCAGDIIDEVGSHKKTDGPGGGQ